MSSVRDGFLDQLRAFAALHNAGLMKCYVDISGSGAIIVEIAGEEVADFALEPRPRLKDDLDRIGAFVTLDARPEIQRRDC